VWLTGALGVDIFFTLSAFLLSELLLRERERFGDVHARAFYIRRGLRIWPLYFAYLGLALALTGAGRNIAVCALFVANFFPPVVQGPLLGPLWSLCIEEQFYLIWPWIVHFCSRERLRWVAGLLWAFSIVYRSLVLSIYGSLPQWGNTLAHLDPIGCGILISATLGKSDYRFNGRKFLAVGGSAMMLTAGLLHAAASLTIRSLTLPLTAIGSGALLIAALGSRSWLVNNRLIIYLGRISYGLYLFHCLILFALNRSLLRGTPLVAPIGLLFTIVLASASYRWYERPFLDIKRRFQFI
jgi:peptidoglycan/LPS O-acetylase OafA/YrhL